MQALIFLFSVLLCAATLVAERAAGIDWDFHPDVVTYAFEYDAVVAGGLAALPNQLYYFLSAAVEGEWEVLVAINVLFYALTNCLLGKLLLTSLSDRAEEVLTKRKIWMLFIFLILFSPYRLHLATHALKDTLIIFFLAATVFARGGVLRATLAWIPLLLLRVYAILYLFIFIRGRWLLLGGIVTGGAMVFFDAPVLDFLEERNEIEMRGREFDTVPTFSEFGLVGSIVRGLLWPLFLLTGGFAALSPSGFFIPVALEFIAVQLWCRYVLRTWAITLGVFLSLAIIGMAVTSFTAYIRYAYPVFVVTPMLLLAQRRTTGAFGPSKPLNTADKVWRVRV